MSNRGPLITLGSVVLLGGIFLATNSAVAKPEAPAATPAHQAAASRPSIPLHALYEGRSSGNEETVAIEINGRKADALLNANRSGAVTVQGTVSGTRVVLTGAGGAAVNATISGTAVFGTVTALGGQRFPFSAELESVHAVYTGRSSGGQVTLAISINGPKAVGYVCNGRTVEAWLQGSVTGSHVSLSGHNGANLTSTISGLAMFGTVTAKAAQSFPFSAALSPRPAGVFRADVQINKLATVIGWAVLPDGTEVGLAVAGATRFPAPTLNLITDTFTVGGASFKAGPVDGAATVVSP
jgi:hypothetical protein